MFPSTGSGSGAAWPAIKPKKDLQINRLKGTQLLTVPDFLTSVGAKAFVDVAESMGFTHQGSLGPLKGEAYRDNDRISVTDPLLAQTLWESGINRIFMDINISGKVATGLNPNIRLYKYVEGQLFGRHIDESVNLGDGSRTQYTLLVYLSGKGSAKVSQALVGGETVFYDHQGGIVAESELLGHPTHEFEPSNYSATELSRRRARRPRAGGSPADRGDDARHLRRGGLQRRGTVLLQICVSVVHPVYRFPRRQRLYDRVLFLHVLSHEEMVERRTSNAQHLILLAELLFLEHSDHVFDSVEDPIYDVVLQLLMLSYMDYEQNDHDKHNGQ